MDRFLFFCLLGRLRHHNTWMTVERLLLVDSGMPAYLPFLPASFALLRRFGKWNGYETALRAFNNIEERRKQNKRATQRKWEMDDFPCSWVNNVCKQAGCRTRSATKESNSETQLLWKFTFSLRIPSKRIIPILSAESIATCNIASYKLKECKKNPISQRQPNN